MPASDAREQRAALARLPLGRPLHHVALGAAGSGINTLMEMTGLPMKFEFSWTPSISPAFRSGELWGSGLLGSHLEAAAADCGSLWQPSAPLLGNCATVHGTVGGGRRHVASSPHLRRAEGERRERYCACPSEGQGATPRGRQREPGIGERRGGRRGGRLSFWTWARAAPRPSARRLDGAHGGRGWRGSPRSFCSPRRAAIPLSRARAGARPRGCVPVAWRPPGAQAQRAGGGAAGAETARRREEP